MSYDNPLIDGIKRTGHLKGLTKSQRWHMEYFMFQMERRGYFYIETGPEKPHHSVTVNSLISKGLIKVDAPEREHYFQKYRDAVSYYGAYTGKVNILFLR
tara:strand:+ start:20 stop:319 length:300 start_codon:yes stop_codon:yes gene_type:complete